MILLPRLIQNDMRANNDKRKRIARIISSYSGIIQFYAVVRFKIIHLRFLEEIEQYLPDQGVIWDLGCGFGLFSLYMALSKPAAHIVGLDINAQRLHIAETSARKLGIQNVSFRRQDLRSWRPEQCLSGAYALDVFHHIPVETGNDLLRDLVAHLEPGGKFLLKDIDTGSRAMLLFTFLLDRLMSPRDRLCYRSASAWKAQLASSGFTPIYLHYLWDLLPYPHILLICVKPISAGATDA